jgi:hypothetical protein
MKKFSYLFATISLLWLASCTKDKDAGGTTAQSLTNEWWAKMFLHGQDQTGYVKYATYNTSNNQDSIWVDDFEGGYGFKVKAKYDLSTNGFATGGSANEYYNGTATYPATAKILDGKVLPGAARSTTGVKTDSLYFKIIFSDSPTDTFVVAGYARTNWADDDH